MPPRQVILFRAAQLQKWTGLTRLHAGDSGDRHSIHTLASDDDNETAVDRADRGRSALRSLPFMDTIRWYSEMAIAVGRHTDSHERTDGRARASPDDIESDISSPEGAVNDGHSDNATHGESKHEHGRRPSMEIHPRKEERSGNAVGKGSNHPQPESRADRASKQQGSRSAPASRSKTVRHVQSQDLVTAQTPDRTTTEVKMVQKYLLPAGSRGNWASQEHTMPRSVSMSHLSEETDQNEDLLSWVERHDFPLKRNTSSRYEWPGSKRRGFNS